MKHWFAGQLLGGHIMRHCCRMLPSQLTVLPSHRRGNHFAAFE
jgi:hypothetical protein